MKAVSIALLSALTLAGCGRSPAWRQAAQTPVDVQDSGYHDPPQIRAAMRNGDTAVTVTGVALAASVARLGSPDGRFVDGPVDASGAWRLNVPSAGPALYGLSQTANGRRDQAEGYLAVLPGGWPAAALLRSGAGTVSLAGRAGKPLLLAADLDSSGAAVVSGWAKPGQAVRILVDGAVASDGTATAEGRFAVSLPKPLAQGARKVQAVTADGAAQAGVEVSAAPNFPGVLRAGRLGSGWRLDWRTPAGGVQTTELFTAPEAGH